MRKVGIIGIGHVGAHVAYSLAALGVCEQLLLADQNKQKVASEVQDLRDSVAYLPNKIVINAADFSELGDCDVIVNSVGKIELLIGNHDRLTEMKFTIPAIHSYIDKVKESGFSGVLINITNPCDVVSYELANCMGLPRGRVFGTGTALDTSRLISAIAQETGLDLDSITAYMLGEHGNEQFAPWSAVNFRGVPLCDMKGECFNFDRDELQKKAIGGGWVTFAGKNCTEYGIATTAARIVKAVLCDEKIIMPATTSLEGEYGESGLFAGVPCVIGKNGVEKILELPLLPDELEKFHKCCQSIKNNLSHLPDMK